MIKIEEIKARWSAAPQGPWQFCSRLERPGEVGCCGIIGRAGEFVISQWAGAGWMPEASADAITNAPEDIRWLVERMERLTSVLDAVWGESLDTDDCADYRLPREWMEEVKKALSEGARHE